MFWSGESGQLQEVGWRKHQHFIDLWEQQSTKRDPPYDPQPYTVVEVQGTQITGERSGRTKTRDSQRWKAISRPPTLLRSEHDDEVDIGVPAPAGSDVHTSVTPRNSTAPSHRTPATPHNSTAPPPVTPATLATRLHHLL